MKELSIIVPIYNVERYVYRCLESLFCQGLNDECFEIIIVNDGTKDNSMDIVQSFISKHSNIIVVNQENRGLSVARNNGLEHASGSYVMFVDSDDFIIENTLSVLLNKAHEERVDMLVADYSKMRDEEEDKFNLNIDRNSYVSNMMIGREAFLSFFNPAQCFIWRTIYRKEFLDRNHLRFIPNIYFEDVPFTIECYLKVGNVLIYPLPFYVYRQHHNSIVSVVNKKKLLDFNFVIAYLWNILNTEQLSKKEHQKLLDAIFVTFSIEIWYLSHEEEGYRHRQQVVEDLKAKVPYLYFNNSFKQRFVSFFYNYFPYAYLWARSINLIK